MSDSLFEQRGREYSQSKLFHHPDRLEHLLLGHYQEIVPVSVELDVTNWCPHRCWYCYQFIWRQLGLNWEAHRPQDQIDFPRASVLVKEMADEGVKAIQFCGRGEPFSYEHFLELLRIVKQAGLQYGVVTSGACLDEAKARALGEAPPTWIRFSIDSVCQEVFNTIRRPIDESFGCKAVMRNMEQASKLVMAGTPDTRLSASTVIVPLNIGHLLDLARFTKSIGLQAHVFRLVNMPGRERVFEGHWEQLEQELLGIKQELQDNTFSVYLPPLNFYKPLEKNYDCCRFSLFDVAIDVNFNVYGCIELIYHPDYLIGNLGAGVMSFKDLLCCPRRIEVIKQVEKCPPCCRDQVNELLEGFVHAMHPDFL